MIEIVAINLPNLVEFDDVPPIQVDPFLDDEVQ